MSTFRNATMRETSEMSLEISGASRESWLSASPMISNWRSTAERSMTSAS